MFQDAFPKSEFSDNPSYHCENRFHQYDSTYHVILNWPERIKTQPHDDRDNCFQHFDSTGLLRYDSEQ